MRERERKILKNFMKLWTLASLKFAGWAQESWRFREELMLQLEPQGCPEAEIPYQSMPSL